VARKKSSAQLDREIAEALSRSSHAEKLGRGQTHHARRNPGRWKGTKVQALLFERPRWTPEKATTWAEEHDLKSEKVHVTDNYVRLRQFAPVRGTQKRTITFGEGIKAVIEQVK
jgi:hypothetical protein